MGEQTNSQQNMDKNKTFISTEYACKSKQNKLTTKQFRANGMEEQAVAIEELITTLPKNHTRQIEMLIKNTTEAMKKMMQLIKNDTKTPVISNETIEEKKKKCKKNVRNITRHQYVNMVIKTFIKKRR
jgi:hypothetical protein